MSSASTPSPPPTTIFGLGKGRIEALTDGIFATVMTVLVLSLSLPTIINTQGLSHYIESLGPTVLSYVLSFLILAVFWVRHHNMFHFVMRVDNKFLWLNISLLLAIGFVPFSTELIGRFPFQEISTVIYGSNMLGAGICMQGIWQYSVKAKLLTSDRISQSLMSSVNRTLTGGPLLYLAAILISIIPNSPGPKIALILYVAALVFYVIASTFNLGPFRFRRRDVFNRPSTTT